VAVSYWRVRILVTNDDGVHAPGLGSLARALARWVQAAGPGEDRSVVVVAPLANFSGASAAVGTVYERESLAYERVHLEGTEPIEVYGLDASPALSAIVGCRGGFGPPPDLVLSGINHGVNVGRSVLHSGTVGAVLTSAQLGVSGLAVSLRATEDAPQWDTAATVAVALLDVLAGAPVPTVLNLNVPSVPLTALRGVRRGHIGGAGLIQGASQAPANSTTGTVSGGPLDGGGERGEIALKLGAAVPRLGEVLDGDPDDDASLVAHGFASLTPILGVREDRAEAADQVMAEALRHLGTQLAS